MWRIEECDRLRQFCLSLPVFKINCGLQRLIKNERNHFQVDDPAIYTKSTEWGRSGRLISGKSRGREGQYLCSASEYEYHGEKTSSVEKESYASLLHHLLQRKEQNGEPLREHHNESAIWLSSPRRFPPHAVTECADFLALVELPHTRVSSSSVIAQQTRRNSLRAAFSR